MVVEAPKVSKLKQSRIVSKVLIRALELWLKSQVEQVEALELEIFGGNRQILTGHIPSVSLAASHAIYQGLHLSQIQLQGGSIRINLSQVIKGKPLRLLEPVPVEGQLLLLERDLQASLRSPLLSTALTDLVNTWLKCPGTSNLAQQLKDQQISWQQIELDTHRLTLKGTLTDASLQTVPVVIHAGIELATKSLLRLTSLQIQSHPEQPLLNLDDFELDLGSEVELDELTLTPGQLLCRGSLKVIP
ncbi:MAG: DUF2993 domain-containing protein [Symploca sp. SIO2C1]|nr:DUF2993 domain-containing protein [Symploca sp. SIO2C1]